MNSQVVSKQRVADHGEVYTSAREVNAMLDLVQAETERIDSRFLEPACGSGNFLVEVLRRKLAVVQKRYARSQLEYEMNAIVAAASVYGVDILPDNVQTCRERLLALWSEWYRATFPQSFKPQAVRCAEFILERNILWGDALSLKTPDDKAEPILFSEWSAVGATMIKRRDYTLAHLLDCRPFEGNNLFSDLGDEAFIPKPVQEFPWTHFLKVADSETPNHEPDTQLR